MEHKSFYHRDIISILDFTRDDLEQLFEYADKFINYRDKKFSILNNKVIALAFFEPSTRTRISFEVASKKLGADVITIVGEEAVSISKGENFADTIRMLDTFSDAIVLRHRFEGAAKYAAEIAENPVINAGDGKQHHPTQAMIDLYTIKKLFGVIDGLTYGILGDLRYSRAAASFIYGLTLFNPKKIYLISPPLLKAREEIIKVLNDKGINFEETTNIEDVLPSLDVLYVIRIQKERFPDPMEYEKVKGSYRITLNLLSKGRKELKVLHPLPKVDEIDHNVDSSPYAAYFTQAKFSIPVRMALLTLLFGVEI